MRAIIAGAILAGCLAGPVHAQGKTKGPEETPMQLEEKQKRQDAAAVDRQYKATLQRTRGNSTTTQVDDPWSNMRGTNDTKPKR